LGKDEKSKSPDGKAQTGTRSEKGYGRMRRQTKFTGISPAVWKECYDRDGGICRHCGKGGVLQACHFVSRARGGMGIPTNLVMLCPDCHREMDQGDGKAIKEEMREYLESLYPMWSEENQKYTKETERC
jgi:5-methylcytosine-specific restriction endonuclease McrA